MANTTKQYDWFWYELMTGDAEAAAKFYGDVVGWKITSFGMGDSAPPYLIGNVNVDGKDRGVVGFMAKPPHLPSEVPPFWSGYLYSDDTDATAAAVKQAGGTVHREPWDIPQVGRIAVLADPEGGLFNVMKPGREEGPPPLDPMATGGVSWCELHSDNPEQNFAWYEKLFGWTRSQAMDMGPGGTYQMFSTNDTPMTGGSCGKMGPTPTHWLYYFSVDALDAAIGRVNAAGGKIFMGPHEVPGGSWIAIGNDPQGGLFALHSQTN